MCIYIDLHLSSRINAKSIRNSEDRKEHAEDNGRISCYEFSLIFRRHVFRAIILFAADHTQSRYDPLMILTTETRLPV